MKAKLTRLEDNLTKTGKLSYIKYKMDGNYQVEAPEIGCSVCLDAGWNPTWLTSPITEIIDENTIKTKNSTYKIEKL